MTEQEQADLELLSAWRQAMLDWLSFSTFVETTFDYSEQEKYKEAGKKYLWEEGKRRKALILPLRNDVDALSARGAELWKKTCGKQV